MLSLEEAIHHCEEVAEKQEITAKSNLMEIDKIKADGILRLYDANEYESCMECAAEHRQLAEWLRELKYYKDRQDLINKNWQELINYKEGIEKIKMRSQSYRERGETTLASGMEQALDILKEVNADEDSD